jgi:hypothetical protein
MPRSRELYRYIKLREAALSRAGQGRAVVLRDVGVFCACVLTHLCALASDCQISCMHSVDVWDCNKYWRGSVSSSCKSEISSASGTHLHKLCILCTQTEGYLTRHVANVRSAQESRVALAYVSLYLKFSYCASRGHCATSRKVAGSIPD